MHPFLSFLTVAAIVAPATLWAAPAVSVVSPAAGSTAGSISSVSVTFNEPVTGVLAGDFSVNGEPVTAVSGSGAGPYVFSFPQPPAGIVTVGWDTDQVVSGIGTGPLATPSPWTYTLTDSIPPAIGKIPSSSTWTYGASQALTGTGQQLDNILPVPGSTATTLNEITVTFSEAVTGVHAGDLLVNGTPALTVTGELTGPYHFLIAQPAAGTVSFSWAGGHGIADLSGNAFAGAGWSVTLAAPGTVRITEFLAANAGTSVMPGSDADGIRDENWDLSPWIELHNSGATPVNLLGWSLTDDVENPAQWVFPLRTLAAGARLIVFASGKDRKPAGGNLHTNFELGVNGGTIALFPPDAPAAFPASAWVNYPPQRYDYSYGALPSDGSARYFSPPSVTQTTYTVPTSDGAVGSPSSGPVAPSGADNTTTALTGVLPEPTASVGRGFFTESFSVILSGAPGATVRYTLDGTPPLVSSTAYTEPLNVTGTTILRAAAFAPDLVPSRAVTHTYLFPSTVVNQPNPPYNHPTVTTDNANPGTPAPGGSPLPVAWGTNSTFTAAQTLPGFATGTATGSNNLTAGKIPADYGMDPKVWADPTKYNDEGAVDAVNGVTNRQRIERALRTLPALSLVMKSTDMFGTYPDGQATAAAAGNPAAPLYPNSSASVKTDMTKACSLELIQPDGETVFVTDAGIDLHGNASRDSFKNPKHGFTVRFKSKYGAGNVEGDIYPDSPVKKWDKLVLRGDFGGSWLHQSGADGSPVSSDASQRARGIRIREAFCKESFRDMGRVASHHRFVNLFINGVCWGSFELMEDEAEDFSSSYLGGDKDLHDVIDQKNDAVLNNRSASLKSGTWNVWSAMKTLLGWTGGSATQDRNVPPAETVLTQAWTNTQYESLKTYLDLPWFQDYMIWQTFGGHRDWANDNADAARYMKNVYFIRPPGGTFKAMPWDMENILWHENEDRITGGTTSFNAAAPITAPSLAPPILIHPRIKSNAEYRLEFADRAWRHMVRPGGALTPEENLRRLNKWTAVVGQDAICLESARWGDYRYKVHAYQNGTVTQVYSWNGAWYDNNAGPQYNGSWSNGIMRFNTGRTTAAQLGTHTVNMSNGWWDEIRRLRTIYFPRRTKNVLWQYRFNDLYPLANGPQLRDNVTNAELTDGTVPAGSLVKLAIPADTGTVSTGDIYYTINGADPRPAYDTAGSPRPGALLYSSPFAVSGPVVIRARMRSAAGGTGAQTAVRAASTVNVGSYNGTAGAGGRGRITLAPLVVDGVTLAAGDRVLLKNQTTPGQNGVWEVATPGTGSSGLWDRAADWDADGEVHMGMIVKVSSGTANAGTVWRMITNGGIIVGGGSGTSQTFAAYTVPAQWSALMEITLTTGLPRPTVVISELNYNPRGNQGGTAGEFIEFWNYGTLPVDMTTWHMEGVDFIFPGSFVLQPGQRVIIANNSNPATFATQYPGVVVLGYFGGTLDNGGERISLLDGEGKVISSVEYDDNGSWPRTPDNGGYSLELAPGFNSSTDIQSSSSWQASSALKGSPGATNSTPAAPTVIVSEFLAGEGAGLHPDFVEILNTGAAPADITGWSVNGATFPITSLAPGARTFATPTLPSKSGEIIIMDANSLVVESVRYGPQWAVTSFYRDGSGAWVLGEPTPGLANVAVVTITGAPINEVMANPVPGQDDWLELYNPDGDDPMVLTGLTVEVNGSFFQITVPAVLAAERAIALPCSHGNRSGDSLNLNLPAAGGTITIRDAAWNVLSSLTWPAQQEGQTHGYLNPGGTTVTALTFPSPGGLNSNPGPDAPVLNEVQAVNIDGDNTPWGTRSGWVEIRNPGPAPLSLAGWSLRSIGISPYSAWLPDTTVPAGGVISVWCDHTHAASLETEPLPQLWNLPLAISVLPHTWGLELVGPDYNVVDRITWGRQIPDMSIGRTGSGAWALLSTPSRDQANAAAAALGNPAGLKINEWFSSSVTYTGLESFIELYNPAALPVDAGGLWLGDAPSEAGRARWQVPGLTFIQGMQHTYFTSGTGRPDAFSFGIANGGEQALLSMDDPSRTAIDIVNFGAAASTATTTQGRLPDGAASTGEMSPTPGASNTAAGNGIAILAQSPSHAVAAGSDVALTVSFSGSYSSIQWFKNGVLIPGVISNTLWLFDVTAADEADYTAVATGLGSATSQPMHLTVLYTWAAYAAQYGLSDIDADADADGISNGAEFLAGSNPNIAENTNTGIVGDTAPGFLSMEYTRSRRAAYTSHGGALSSDLSVWNDAEPAMTEVLSTSPNGDQRLKLSYPVTPGATRQFLKLRLTP